MRLLLLALNVFSLAQIMVNISQPTPSYKEIPVNISLIQKKPRVRNSSARNSGAGNGCANLWVPGFLVLSAGKPHAHKFLVWGGGGGLGAGNFSD